MNQLLFGVMLLSLSAGFVWGFIAGCRYSDKVDKEVREYIDKEMKALGSARKYKR